MIVAGYDICHKVTYLEPWFTSDLKFINIKNLLPYVMFDEWSLNYYTRFDLDMTTSYGIYNSSNEFYDNDSYFDFTIENGAIVIADEHGNDWFDYDGISYTSSYENSYQVVSSIGRYDVVQNIYKHSYGYYSEDFKDKTWYDIINSELSSHIFKFNSYVFNDDGTVSLNYGYKTELDEKITYKIEGDNLTLTHSYCYNDCSCSNWKEKYTLFSSRGEIVSDDKYIYLSVVSSTLIADNSDILIFDENYKKETVRNFVSVR